MWERERERDEKVVKVLPFPFSFFHRTTSALLLLAFIFLFPLNRISHHRRAFSTPFHHPCDSRQWKHHLLCCFAWAFDLWLRPTRFAGERYTKTQTLRKCNDKFYSKTHKIIFIFSPLLAKCTKFTLHLRSFPDSTLLLLGVTLCRTYIPRNEMIKRVSERNNIKHGEESETVAAVDIIQYSIRKLLLQISSRKVSVRVQHITISSVWNVKTLQVCSFIHYDCCRLHRHQAKVSCGEQVEFDVRKLSLMSHNRDMSTIKKRHSVCVCVWGEQKRDQENSLYSLRVLACGEIKVVKIEIFLSFTWRATTHEMKSFHNDMKTRWE